MRRLVALLVLLVTPLQWTYAAVAEYCEHEPTLAAQQHVGHHAHQHVDAPASKETSDKGSLDWDCPACHHAANGAAPGTLDASLSTDGLRMVASASRQIRHRDPDTPFRPPLVAGA